MEAACLAALPALKQITLDGWLLRISGGSIRRVNSVNPLKGNSYDPSRIIAEAQSIYAAQAQPTLFRVPDIARGMDATLEREGFTAEGETCTLFADLDGHRSNTESTVEITARPTSEWLNARAKIASARDTDRHIYRGLVQAITSPAAFAAVRSEGEIAGLAYGVVHDGLLVLESVATAPAYRRRGFGEQVVRSLMDWSIGEGVKGACLQVVADNAPAHALYAKLGFGTELYRYHYRRDA